MSGQRGMHTPARVLIVEDDRATNSLIAEILREAGFTVTSRTTVAEGLEHLREAATDVVIADYRLPDGPGTDICRVALSMDLPTIVISAYPSSLELAIDADVDGWIGKPFAADEVVSTVRRVLRRGRDQA